MNLTSFYKYLLVVSAVLTLVFQNSYSIENKGIGDSLTSKNHYNVPDTLQKDASDNAIKSSSNTSADKLLPDEPVYVPKEQFIFAGTPRYTIDGSLPYAKTKIKPIPAITLGSIYTGLFYLQHRAQENTIWKEKAKFKFAEDAQYTAYLDKAGHFYGTYMPAYILTESFMMSGFSWDLSTILGSALGLAYTGYVEVLDGYGKNWGFSPSDFYADIAGASFFLAQHYVPFLQNFTPKFLYVKPSWIGEHDRREAEAFIDNYSAQTFWMSINVHNLLPEGIQDYWPKWLELSVGYAVYSLSEGVNPYNVEQIPVDPQYGEVFGNKKLLISLDYNLRELLPDGPGFWNWFKQGLDHFKLPSPVLEIGKTKTRFYLMYPFPLRIG